jgi:hypothetical protein
MTDFHASMQAASFRVPAGRLSILIFSVFLTAGCVSSGSLQIGAVHFPVDTIEKVEPDKTYGETVFDTISEEPPRRRVIGWIDRAT